MYITSLHQSAKSTALLWMILLSGIFTNLNAQSQAVDSIELRLHEQLIAYPQEKIHLQTDKAAYLSGERIWFRSHLVDALTHRPSYLSRYVYVELISPMEDLMERIMIRPDSTGAYSGYVDLADDLTEGSYTLRAYTNFMRNGGEETFFKKSIEILDPFSLQIDPRLSFDIDGNNVAANIRFIDRRSNDTILPEIVSCKLTHKQEKTLKPNKDKAYSWNVNLPAKLENRTMLLSLMHNGRKYRKYYTIPFDRSEYEVAFFPEGGYIVPGTICQVAFKALNPGGLGEEISGQVFNSKDEELVRFNSMHLGMGFFNFMVQPDESYYALCENSDGDKKRVELPAVAPDAATISVRMVGNRIIAAILGGEELNKEKLSLLVHHKGQLIFHETLKSNSQAYTFPAENMPMGVLSLMLLDEKQNILSERLAFNFDENRLPKLDFNLPPNSYKRRGNIRLTMKLADEGQNPLRGNFALAITDKNGVVEDSMNTVVSSLLLSSELKGFIESPASYFKDYRVMKRPLDALMMTQGWRRYDIPKVLKGKIEIPDMFEPEVSQKITGKADGLFTSLKDGEISLMATLDSMLSTVVTQADNKGRFTFQVEYPAGTSILVQSLSKRGSKMNSINLDLKSFPDVLGGGIPLRANAENRHDTSLDSYLQKADDEYTRQYGIRTILLDEVTVVAKTVEKYKESAFYSPLSATGVRTAEDIEKMKFTSLRSLLYSQPGVIVRSDRVTTTRSEMPILFVIDDMRFEDFFDRLDDIDVNSIESLFVVRDNSMMPGYYPGTDGAIVITTKIGFTPKPRKPPNIDKIIPLGYQQAAEFYSPVYDTPEKVDSSAPDLRTTIFWKPNLLLDETGSAVVEFYAADLPTTYRVIIEGASDSGMPVRAEHAIAVEESSVR